MSDSPEPLPQSSEKPKGRTILVCGSREWRDHSAVHLVLMSEPHAQGWDDEPIAVITGGARGADTFADLSAIELGYESIIVRADWAKYGKAAGPIRNRQMLDLEPDLEPDLVVGFGRGRGTDDCCGEAERRGIPVKRF